MSLPISASATMSGSPVDAARWAAVSNCPAATDGSG